MGHDLPVKRRGIVPLVIVLAAALTVACAPLPGFEDIMGYDEKARTGEQAEQVTSAREGGAMTRKSTTLAGDNFVEDVVLARTLTEQYWQQQFAADGREYRPIQQFIPYVGNNGPSCGDQRATPDNAFYCPIGHFVAFDERWLEDLYNKIGDGAVYVIIPHELGHAVQAQLTTDFKFNKDRELQADCYAGNVIGWLVKANRLTQEEGDDAELFENLAAAGDPTDEWWRPDAHGTGPERQAAFQRGYENGIQACAVAGDPLPA
jgi:predicted metalloprotease